MSLQATEQRLRKAVPTEHIRQLMQLDPGRVARDLALDWAGVVAGFILASRFHGVVPWLAAGLCIGLSQYALFIIGHDGMHFCLHPNRQVNDGICRWLVYGPMFMGLADSRRNHLEHHRLVGTEADPDRYLHSLENKNSRLGLVLFCTGLATFVRTFMKVTPLGSMQKGTANGSEPVLGRFVRQRVPALVTQPLILGAIVLVGLPWWSYFVLWVAPIYFCVFLLDEIRAFCDHAVLRVPDAAADESRFVSFVPSRIEAAFFSPHAMNYHAEHHVWPGVPYYRRASLHKALLQQGVVARRSYVQFLFDMMGRLPLTPEP